MTKIVPICSTCGSTEVMLDAWAEWDPEGQEWVLRSTHDNAYCECCEGETNIIDAKMVDTGKMEIEGEAGAYMVMLADDTSWCFGRPPTDGTWDEHLPTEVRR